MESRATTPRLYRIFPIAKRLLFFTLVVLLGPISFAEAQTVAAGDSFSCAVQEGRVKCWGANESAQLGKRSLRSAESSEEPAPIYASAHIVDEIDTAVRIVTGDYFACVVLEAGEVACWGSNRGAVIGKPARYLRTDSGFAMIDSVKTPQMIRGLSGRAIQISTGSNSEDAYYPTVCALIESGEVMCWGDNDPVPRPVAGIAGASKISGNCALIADSGEVYCWSHEVVERTELEGELVTVVRRTAEPFYLGGHRAVDIAISSSHSCIIESMFRRVVCWGENNSGQVGAPPSAPIDAAFPFQIFGTEDSVSITVGTKHSCAIIAHEEDATVAMCWGENEQGQLGNGFDSANNVHITVWPVNNVDNPVEIAAGRYHTCAKSRDEEMWCWGNDGDGATGRPERTFQKRRLPLEVNGLPRISTYTAGSTETCGRSLGNNVLCVGDGEFKRLNPETQSFYTPYSGTHTAVANLKQLDTNNGVMCAIGADDGLYCWGENSIGRFATNLTDFDAGRRTSNPIYYGRLGYAPSDYSHDPSFRTKPFKITRAISRLDQQLGNYSSFEDAEFLTVSVGTNHACAITAPFWYAGNGNRKVLCWGSNVDGESGAVTRISPGSETSFSNRHFWNKQVQHIPVALSTHTGETAPVPTLATGEHFSCIATDSIVWCWGSDEFGTRSGFRHGPNGYEFNQLLREPNNIKQITAGKHHACVLLESGSVKCWGDDTKGQLGNGPVDSSGSGVQTVGGIDNAVQIAAAGEHTCALTESEIDGELIQSIKCWGSNEDEQIDREASAIVSSPRRILNHPMDIVSIDAGEKHNCALYEDQVLRCWGNNDDGQLGSLYQVKPMHVDRY